MTSQRTGRGQLTAGRFVVNATTVEDKGTMRRVDADGHRSVFEQRQLESVSVARRDVCVTVDRGEQVGFVGVAESILWRPRRGGGGKEEVW